MERKLLLTLISILGFSFQSIAQGNLMVTPTRVVFEGNKQKEELNVANIGKDTATYSVSFIQKDMREDGSFVNMEKNEPGHMFADPYLRIFPRTITLAPGEAQVIGVQFRRKAEMTAGEYRSHLYFRSEKNYKPLNMVNPGKDTTAGLNIQLIPVFGISIPIIIRTGAVNVSVSLDDLKLDQQNTTQYLKLTILRTGNISLYGDLLVQYIPVQGKPYQIGTMGGIGVYTNLNKRYVAVKLNNTSGKLLKDGKLKVQYISKEESRKTVVYAEAMLNIK